MRDRILASKTAIGAPSELCDATIRAVLEHGRGRPQFDDLTVVAARVL